MKRLSPSQQEALDPSTKPERLRELVTKSKTHENLVAGNRSTPADLLIALSKKNERRINERLAKNASTPLQILLPLVQKFPREFLANPVLPLLFLEDSFASSLTEGAYEALLSCSEAPAIFCQWAYQKAYSPKVLVLIVKHPNASTELLEQAAQEGRFSEETICAAILRHPNSTPKIAATLATASNVRVSKAAQNIALSPYYQALFEKARLFQGSSESAPPLSEEDIYALAELGTLAQQRAASQQNCPRALLYSLAETNPRLRSTIATNPSAPPELLASLAKEYPGESGYFALSNPSFPEEHLAHFATGPYHLNVRHAAVIHPKAPESLLRSLLQDPSNGIRNAAEKNLAARADQQP